MNHAHTHLDLIQPDQYVPTDREVDERASDLLAKLKANPPSPDIIFDLCACLPADFQAMRDALRNRDACEAGRIVMACFDAWCADSSRDLAYGQLVDDLTAMDREVLIGLGEYRQFMA